MKYALVLIDIQNDYFSGGRMELVGMDKAAIIAHGVLEKFRKIAAPIFHIQHVSTRADATFFLPNTAGVQIHERVKPLEDERVIVKHYPIVFAELSCMLC